MFQRRLHARSVIAAIVGVCTVDHTRDAEFAEHGLGQRVQSVFTEVAPISRVGSILGALKLRRGDFRVTDADGGSGAAGVFEFGRGQTGADGGHRDRSISQSFFSSPSNNGAVDASRKGHGDSVQFANDFHQLLSRFRNC